MELRATVAAIVDEDPSLHWGQYQDMCPCLLHL